MVKKQGGIDYVRIRSISTMATVAKMKIGIQAGRADSDAGRMLCEHLTHALLFADGAAVEHDALRPLP